MGGRRTTHSTYWRFPRLAPASRLSNGLCPAGPSLEGKEPFVKEPLPDDILATDFLKKPWQEEVGNKTKIGEDKERLDQMLCHLSYNRNKLFKDTDRKNRPWYTANIVVAMLCEL